HPGRLLDQFGGGRGLGDEGERPVLVNGDLDRDDVAALVLRRGVVLPDEVHDVDAVRAERGADRRRGRGGAGAQLHLDDCGDLLPSRWHLAWSLLDDLRGCSRSALAPAAFWPRPPGGVLGQILLT